jgi:hypothetical protein
VKHARLKLVAAVAVVGVVGMGTAALANSDHSKEHLTGYEETPALSTPGSGDFRLDIHKDSVDYKLTFSGLESDATQAHIHFENATNAGNVMTFLCSNLGNAPAGTQACPAAGGTITGTIKAADIIGGAAGQGIAAGEFDEFVAALRSGATYVNVHSTLRPAGEIRAQINDHRHHDDDD